MTRELRDNGLAVGRRRTARLMRENGLVARQKRRFKRTTDSEHQWPVAPNLLDQDFTAARPDEKWGADISYVWTREGWLYLAVVIDLYARRVVGWATGERLHRDLALAALRKALTTRQPAAGLIHHSDRGSQGGFKRSSQHLLGSSGARRQVPRPEIAIRVSCATWHSMLREQLRDLGHCAHSGRCLSGITAVAGRWCSRWCRVARDCAGRRSRPARRCRHAGGRAGSVRLPDPRSASGAAVLAMS